MMGALGEDVVERRGCGLVSGEKVVEPVPGREMGDDTLRGWGLKSARSVRSAAFRLLEVGRGGEEEEEEGGCSGFPKTRPTAATPTVLDATSYYHETNPEISIIIY